MPRTARERVRTAVGVAAVAPAAGLLVLAVFLMKGGGGGILAGLFVAVLVVALLFIALMMTHAPVSIHRMLMRSERKLSQKDPSHDQSSTRSEAPGGKNSD